MRPKAFLLPLLLLATLLFSACASSRPRDFAGRTPQLDPLAYYTGTRHATGVIEDRFGKVRGQFTATNIGIRRGRELHLQQHFRYADGHTEHRTWRLHQVDAHRYTGTANDSIGPMQAEAYGNAVRLRYTLRQPGVGPVKFDQLMLLQPGGILVNHVRFSKFGVRLGDVHEFFHPRGR